MYAPRNTLGTNKRLYESILSDISSRRARPWDLLRPPRTLRGDRLSAFGATPCSSPILQTLLRLAFSVSRQEIPRARPSKIASQQGSPARSHAVLRPPTPPARPQLPLPAPPPPAPVASLQPRRSAPSPGVRICFQQGPGGIKGSRGRKASGWRRPRKGRAWAGPRRGRGRG